MASTAWTAPRAELVKALAEARTRQQIAEANAAAARAELDKRRATRHARELRYREKRRVVVVAEAIDQLARASRLIETIPADPNAAQHRRDLIAALKEKP